LAVPFENENFARHIVVASAGSGMADTTIGVIEQRVLPRAQREAGEPLLSDADANLAQGFGEPLRWVLLTCYYVRQLVRLGEVPSIVAADQVQAMWRAIPQVRHERGRWPLAKEPILCVDVTHGAGLQHLLWQRGVHGTQVKVTVGGTPMGMVTVPRHEMLGRLRDFARSDRLKVTGNLVNRVELTAQILHVDIKPKAGAPDELAYRQAPGDDLHYDCGLACHAGEFKNGCDGAVYTERGQVTSGYAIAKRSTYEPARIHK
jgi:hypothetical protein